MEKLSVEDKILGRKEPMPKTDLQLKAFTSETKYKVNSIGKDNPSVMNGEMLKSILPLKQREKICMGDIVIEYNGLRIERIVDTTDEPTISKKETVDEEISVTEEVKPKTRKRTK